MTIQYIVSLFLTFCTADICADYLNLPFLHRDIVYVLTLTSLLLICILNSVPNKKILASAVNQNDLFLEIWMTILRSTEF
jgi:hypothetical protein